MPISSITSKIPTKLGMMVDFTAKRVTITNLVAHGRDLAGLYRRAASDVKDWVETYKHVVHFFEDWRWLRMNIDLQTRLFVEQVLTDMGEPWKAAVTGFAAMVRKGEPVGDRGRSERIPFKKSKRLKGRYLPTAKY